jgi:hypothetical protein
MRYRTSIPFIVGLLLVGYSIHNHTAVHHERRWCHWEFGDGLVMGYSRMPTRWDFRVPMMMALTGLAADV